MELRHLRYFIAVAEEQNVTRAARRLHLSQPPLSRQIRDLEAELGVELLQRIGRSVRLTEAGRYFLDKARRIVCDAETTAQQLRELYSTAPRTLRAGFIGPVLDDLIAPAVRALRQRHPRTKVSLFELSPRAQLDRLANHELDVAVLGNLEPHDHERFSVRRLWSGRMILALPESHPLAGSRSVQLAALADAEWVSLAESSFPGRRALLQAACRRAGFEPRIVSEADTLPLMLASVAAGDGVALMPEHAAKVPHAGCALVPIRRPVPTIDLWLVTHDPVESRELEALIEALSGQAARGALASRRPRGRAR